MHWRFLLVTLYHAVPSNRVIVEQVRPHARAFLFHWNNPFSASDLSTQIHTPISRARKLFVLGRWNGGKRNRMTCRHAFVANGLLSAYPCTPDPANCYGGCITDVTKQASDDLVFGLPFRSLFLLRESAVSIEPDRISSQSEPSLSSSRTSQRALL